MFPICVALVLPRTSPWPDSFCTAFSSPEVDLRLDEGSDGPDGPQPSEREFGGAAEQPLRTAPELWCTPGSLKSNSCQSTRLAHGGAKVHLLDTNTRFLGLDSASPPLVVVIVHVFLSCASKVCTSVHAICLRFQFVHRFFPSGCSGWFYQAFSREGFNFCTVTS